MTDTIGQGDNAVSTTPEHLARIEQWKKHKELYYDFARYVIGWGFPSWQGERLFSQGPHGKVYTFAPDVLENVIMWVANWCDENESGFCIAYGNTTDQRLGDPDYSVFINGFESTNNSLCIALIDACLEAEKERAQEHKVQP